MPEGKKDKKRGGGGCEKKLTAGGMLERVKKTKCGGGGGGGGCEKNLRAGGMLERVKKTKCLGDVAKKWGGYARDGKENKMRGCCCEKKLRGGGLCQERVKKTKCGGGCCEKNLRGGMPERVKKTKCGGREKMGGGLDHKKKSRAGGSVENYVFLRGGQILNGIAHYSWPMKSFVTKAKKHILIIEWKWNCSLRSFYLLFDIIELQIKSFHYRTANEKLSNANENYRMQMKIIACKWKLSHANENYPMQMKINACKWKLSNANETLSNANEKSSNANEKLSHANEKLSNANEKIEYCNVSHAIFV